MIEFKEFPKIPRLTRGCVITEKIDGTNAQVYIGKDPGCAEIDDTSFVLDAWVNEDSDYCFMLAGSRTRWIKPGADNFGFAGWVKENSVELRKLGQGQHFGEWYGQGIQRRYGLTEKRFSLFNTARWNDKNPNRPACCSVVPKLYHGIFDTKIVEEVLANLATNGSVAAPGFMNPEGIVVYHEATRSYFKKTIDKDDEPKGKVSE